jgi:ComEC/Rec2-related protein
MRGQLAGKLPFTLFLFFAGGILYGHRFCSFPFFFFCACSALVAGYFFFRGNKLFLSDACVMLLFFSLGALWVLPFSSPAKDTFFNKPRTVTLQAVSLPNEARLRNSFFAQIRDIEGIPFSARVRVFDYTKQMQYLHRYRIEGVLRKRNYGQREVYSFWVKKSFRCEELPYGWFTGVRIGITQGVLSFFRKNVSEQAYRFLASVFLGRRELLADERESFSNAGVSHLLAISGLHIGLTSLVIFFLLRMVFVPFKANMVISLVFIVFYTVLTGMGPSTVRAAIMYGVFAISFFMKRRASPYNSLGLAGLAILLVDPQALLTIGFQLSFLSVYSIITGFRTLAFRRSRNATLRSLQYLFFTSLFVTAGITPLVSYYFGRIYVLNIFYNVVLIPFFTLILTVNFIFLIFSPFHGIASSIGELLSGLVGGFRIVVSVLGRWDISSFPVRLSFQGVALYYLCAGALLLGYRYWRKMSGGVSLTHNLC